MLVKLTAGPQAAPPLDHRRQIQVFQIESKSIVICFALFAFGIFNNDLGLKCRKRATDLFI